MKQNLFERLLTAIFAVTLMLSVVGASPVLAQTPEPPAPKQEDCDLIVAGENVAQWGDQAWEACFVAGMVNAVVDPKHPLPEKFSPIVANALEKGAYLQLTEPHGDGCDNTFEHPKCSIGFLKLFSTRERLIAFLAKGEFEQAGITKKGPWTEYSLWVTKDFVQVADGDEMSKEDAELFCSGALVLSFAFDGDFPLPEENPCEDEVLYSIGERWNGGCDGNALPDVNCNVGERIQVENWDEVNASTIGSGWNRGSVRVVVASDVATATPTAGMSLLPVVTNTPATPVAAGNTPAVTNTPATPVAAGNTPAVTNTPATPVAVGKTPVVTFTSTAPATFTPVPTATSTLTPTPEVEVTEEGQAALPSERPEGANTLIGVGIFILVVAGLVVVGIILAAIRNNRRNAADQQPAGKDIGGSKKDTPDWLKPGE